MRKSRDRASWGFGSSASGAFGAIARAVSAAMPRKSNIVRIRQQQVESLEQRKYMWGGGSGAVPSMLHSTPVSGYYAALQASNISQSTQTAGSGDTTVQVNNLTGAVTVGISPAASPKGGPTSPTPTTADSGSGGSGGGANNPFDTTAPLWWTNNGALPNESGDAGISTGFALLDLPYLAIAGSSLTLYNGSQVSTYDQDSTVTNRYNPRGDDTGQVRLLTVDSREFFAGGSFPTGTDTYYVWTGIDGTRMYFDASTGVYRGQTDPYGNETTITRTVPTGGGDVITELDQWQGTASSTGTPLARISYAYTDETYTELSSATYYRQDSQLGNALTAYKQLGYQYYDTSDGTNGVTGQVKFITDSEFTPGSTTPFTVDTSYIRYDGRDFWESIGGEPPIAAVYGPQEFARLVANDPTNYDTSGPYTDEQYASTVLTYNSDQSIATEIVAGSVTGTTVAQGTITYTYSDLTMSGGGGTHYLGGGSPTYGVNQPVAITAIGNPDGSVEYVYLNAAGQMLIDHTWNGQTGSARQDWVTSDEYDNEDRLHRVANPSAATWYASSSYSGSGAFWDNPSTTNPYGDAFVVAPSAGLINITDYGGADTSDTPSASLVADIEISNGDTATPVELSSYTYVSHSFTDDQSNVFTAYHLASSITYPTSTTSGERVASNSYTYDILGPATVTVFLPAITTGHNGSGSSYQELYTYDSMGNITSVVNGDGITNTYTYDLPTGAVTQVDVDAGTGGLGLITLYQNDLFGRVTREIDPKYVTNTAGSGSYSSGAIATYYVYNDAAHSLQIYPGWTLGTTGGPANIGPVTEYQTNEALGYSQVLTYVPTFNSGDTNSSTGAPVGTDTITYTESLSRTLTDPEGQVIETDRYFTLGSNAYSTNAQIGAANATFYATTYGYDAMGRQNESVSPTGTIYAMTFDAMGRDVADSVGTSATNMVTTAIYQYDNGGTGDSNLTEEVTYVDDVSGSGDNATARATASAFDWRDRLVWQKQGALLSTSGGAGTFTLDPTRETNTMTGWTGQQAISRPLSIYTYDNLDEVTEQQTYDGDTVGYGTTPATGALTGQTTWAYDEWARAYSSSVYSVDPSSGAVGTNALTTSTWYDGRGLVVKSISPNGPGMMYVYDGAGRETNAYDVLPSDVTGTLGLAGSTVIQQTDWQYDANGNVIVTATRQRFDSATGTGPLSGVNGTSVYLGTSTSYTGPQARVYYEQFIYDTLDREVDDVNVGAIGTNTFTPYTTAPASSATVLVTGYTYDAAGRQQNVTSPNGNITRSLYDLAGRVTDTYQNWNATASASGSTNVHTGYTYDGDDHVTEQIAYLPTGGYQETQFDYGVGIVGGSGVVGGSGIYSNDLLSGVQYADPTTGLPSTSSAQWTSYTYDIAGEQQTFTDRNYSMHEYSYDSLGRLDADVVPTPGGGIETNVSSGTLAITYTYSKAGQLATANTFNNATLNNLLTGTYRVTQLAYTYDGFGNLVQEVEPQGSVTYTFSDGSNNTSRLTGESYGQESLTYLYNTGIDSAISRVSGIQGMSVAGTSGTTLETYTYLGLSTLVAKGRPEDVPTTNGAVGLTYISNGATGDAGDKYIGLDRFGRIADQRWTTSSGADFDRLKYTYDQDSNPLAMVNTLSTVNSEAFTYDGLDRLASYQRGTVTVTGTTSPTVTATGVTQSEAWNLDSEGNWGTFSFAGGTTNVFTRTINAQNAYTSQTSTASGSHGLTYDNDGNEVSDGSGDVLTYDAWNHLVQWSQPGSGGALATVTYTYDALGEEAVRSYVTHPVTTAGQPSTTGYLYSSNGQDLVELSSNVYTSSSPTESDYVYSAEAGAYSAELLLRDDFLHPIGTGGSQARTQAVSLSSSTTFNDRVYVRQDASYDVTSTDKVTYNTSTSTASFSTERYVEDPYGAHVTVLNSNFTTKTGGTGWSWRVFSQGLFQDTTTGLYNNAARWCDPVQGRFISQDPTGWPDGANGYASRNDNPAHYVDPKGLSWEHLTKEEWIKMTPGEREEWALQQNQNQTNRDGSTGYNPHTSGPGSSYTPPAWENKVVWGLRILSAVAIVGAGAFAAADAAIEAELELEAEAEAEAEAVAENSVTVTHFTSAEGADAITNGGSVLNPGSYVTTPGEVAGMNASQVESTLEIDAGKGAFSSTFQTPASNLTTPANGAFTSGGATQFQLINPTPVGPFVPTPL